MTSKAVVRGYKYTNVVVVSTCIGMTLIYGKVSAIVVQHNSADIVICLVLEILEHWTIHHLDCLLIHETSEFHCVDISKVDNPYPLEFYRIREKMCLNEKHVPLHI